MRLLRPPRTRDFALLLAGATVSLAGDGIYLVAIAFQVLALVNEPSTLSLVLVAWSAGLVACLPIAGVIVDRLDRRTALIAAGGARLAATATLGTLSVTGAVELWHCAAVAFVVGAGTACQHGDPPRRRPRGATSRRHGASGICAARRHILPGLLAVWW